METQKTTPQKTKSIAILKKNASLAAYQFYPQLSISMEKTIRLNTATTWYLFCLACWGTIVAVALSLQSKGDIFLLVNHFRSPFLNILGTAFTFVGDGAFTLILAAILLFTKHRKLAWLTLCAFLLSTIVCQVAKNLADESRPAGYFPDPSIVKTAAWISLKRFNSFPSGHTTSAFATATILAFYYKKTWLSWLCIICAILVGYSRVYLGQHFVGDVFVGSIIGSLSAFFCLWNQKNPIIQKGLGLEYLFKKKNKGQEQ